MLILAVLAVAIMLGAGPTMAITPQTGNHPECNNLKDDDGDGYVDCADQFSCWSTDQCTPDRILVELEKFAEFYAARCNSDDCRALLASIRTRLGSAGGDLGKLKAVRDDLDKLKGESMLERLDGEAKKVIAEAIGDAVVLVPDTGMKAWSKTSIALGAFGHVRTRADVIGLGKFETEAGPPPTPRERRQLAPWPTTAPPELKQKSGWPAWAAVPTGLAAGAAAFGTTWAMEASGRDIAVTTTVTTLVSAGTSLLVTALTKR